MTDSLHQEALERAAKVGISPDLMEMALRAERKDRPYIVELESKVEGSFYRCTQEGPSKILYINTHHPFFVECYMAEGSTPEYRDGLEIFLWVLGLGELEAEDERTRKFYVSERHIWSQRLGPALKQLAIAMDMSGARNYDEAVANRDSGWDEEDEV